MDEDCQVSRGVFIGVPAEGSVSNVSSCQASQTTSDHVERHRVSVSVSALIPWESFHHHRRGGGTRIEMDILLST